MGTDMSISTAEDRLRLAHWLSPAFPIGGFAYSQGLELPMATGQVQSADEVDAWVRDCLSFGTLRMDAIFLARARAGDDPEALSDLILAYASSAERELELLEQGRAFTALMAAMSGAAVPVRPYPVAVGVASRALSLPDTEVIALFLQGAAAQMISAATRFLPLGQSESQVMLAQLAPLVTTLAEIAAAATLDDLGTFTPGADIAAMRHETLEVRIFRT
jgi:urease accessory protein